MDLALGVFWFGFVGKKRNVIFRTDGLKWFQMEGKKEKKSCQKMVKFKASQTYFIVFS